MFHLNFIILAAPIFGIWFELIIAKLITMAYQVKLFSLGIEINQFYHLWTEDPEKMLIVEDLNGLELLILAGFMEYHYMFSIVFGAVAVAVERICASVLIDNYESTKKVFIPIFLTIIVQILAIFVSSLAIFYKFDIISINATWIVSCIFSSVMFLLVERINEKWRAEMENPRRTRNFTISQRFQVKENIRALDLGKRLIFSEIGTISIIGTIIAALLLELVPPSLVHIAENALFLNPFGICTVAMFSIPAWKKRYKNAFPTCCQWRLRPSRVDVESMEPMEEFNKRISIETDINYESNTKLFIPFLLTVIYQTFAIFTSLSVLFHKFNSIASHIPWILSCVIAAFVYLFVKKVNESFRREIKSSNRKRAFTISQQFQVKENLRALRLGTRLVFVVLGTIAVCGSGMAALTFQIIPSYFSHIIENFTFLNPYLILLTAMFSVPQWEKKFKRMLLTWHFLKKRKKFVNVEIAENSKKDLDMETNLYFKQLADSWI
ncbi:unnamed protein product [Caenorhabditis nigoni]